MILLQILIFFIKLLVVKFIIDFFIELHICQPYVALNNNSISIFKLNVFNTAILLNSTNTKLSKIH